MLTVSEKDPYKKFYAAHVMITSKCNLRCYYCYYPPRSESDPTLEQFDYTINEFEKLGEPGIFYEISGGEPMIRSDWSSVMRLFLDTGRDVVLNTNGSRISDTNADKLANLYQEFGNKLYLSISLDSCVSNVHNKIRGLYAQTVEGMERVRDRQIPFRVSITLTRHNRDTLSDTVGFVVDKLTQEVMVGILRPVFPMTEANKASMLSLGEVQAACQEIEKLRRGKGFEFYHCLGKDGQPGCMAGYDRAAVGSNGDIYPCYALQHIVLGDIYTDGLLNPILAFRERTKNKSLRDLLCEHPRPTNGNAVSIPVLTKE